MAMFISISMLFPLSCSIEMCKTHCKRQGTESEMTLTGRKRVYASNKASRSLGRLIPRRPTEFPGVIEESLRSAVERRRGTNTVLHRRTTSAAAVYQQALPEVRPETIPFISVGGNRQFGGAHLPAMKGMQVVRQPRITARQVNIDLPRFFHEMTAARRTP